jgi:hypothetical protein
VQAEGFVRVTDNASDFRPMFAREEIHPGLAVLPAEYGRAGQQRLAGVLIDFIVEAAGAAGESPANLMVNRLARRLVFFGRVRPASGEQAFPGDKSRAAVPGGPEKGLTRAAF